MSLTTATGSSRPSSGEGSSVDNLLVVDDLHVIRRSKGVQHNLLRGISFVVPNGSRVGIVGESGSGKSLTASAILRLVPEGIAQSSGRIVFAGRDLGAASEREMHTVRGAQIAMIYQNALASLNPLFPVGKQIAAVCRAHLKLSRKDASSRASRCSKTLGSRTRPAGRAITLISSAAGWRNEWPSQSP